MYRGMFILQDCRVREEPKIKNTVFSIQVTKHASMMMGNTTTLGTFFFEAANEKEKNEWIQAIRKAARLAPQGITDGISIKTAWKEYLKTNQTTLVTCAASSVGMLTVRTLLLRGTRVRALVATKKDVKILREAFGQFIEIIDGDLFKGIFYTYLSIHILDPILLSAVKGVSRIIIICPTTNQFVKFVRQLLQAAQQEKSIQHIVKLSDWCDKFPTELGKNHIAAEQYIQKAKFCTFTFVRMNAPMSNFKNYFASDIQGKGSFSLPLSPNTTVSYVSLNDVAAVLVEVSAEDKHIGKVSSTPCI